MIMGIILSFGFFVWVIGRICYIQGWRSIDVDLCEIKNPCRLNLKIYHGYEGNGEGRFHNKNIIINNFICHNTESGNLLSYINKENKLIEGVVYELTIAVTTSASSYFSPRRRWYKIKKISFTYKRGLPIDYKVIHDNHTKFGFIV